MKQDKFYEYEQPFDLHMSESYDFNANKTLLDELFSNHRPLPSNPYQPKTQLEQKVTFASYDWNGDDIVVAHYETCEPLTGKEQLEIALLTTFEMEATSDDCFGQKLQEQTNGQVYAIVVNPNVLELVSDEEEETVSDVEALGEDVVEKTSLQKRVDKHELWLRTRDTDKVQGKQLNLDSKYIKGVDLSGRNLTDANFGNADIRNVNFTNANLTNAFMMVAFMIDTNLTGANLTGANLTGVDAEHAIFVGANLTNANFTDADCRKADFTNAIMENVNFTNTKSKGAIFDEPVTTTDKDFVDAIDALSTDDALEL